ncbi:alcohol dehydrogenase catalytic domain-containing protein [Roseateles violae]|uniref:Alcohol dehydrogenase catalytic domain-containing protein n=1 Tax=Roseateles violae TaxID=3058042 RepID=A0ABT8DZC2_9BURK|nr:alcohol dehydrogenase catalytic domain-containing protein [Pelomonas sp. PFR6]MDN3922917.1 alcohol dehydrogenase catalytic domain-containing protein [Pelomonas sp. PFR6]
MRHELICSEPATPARLTLRSAPLPQPGSGEVLVRVQASSVNPIDVKRAAGYGRRLLGLKGAARFPLALGNDVAGLVVAVGADVTGIAAGQRVFGLLPTGRAGGAHATHVLVSEQLLRVAPEEADPAALAVLPYSFTTMWLALRSAGLKAANARGARVLVHGASGGLGSLALQQLRLWGSQVTAICAKGRREEARALGAQLTVERGPLAIASLPSDFDVVLNFANWDDDDVLASRLGPQALGQATTVHPLLANFDRLGWLGGMLATRRDRRCVQAAVVARAPRARYSWTLFKPDRAALDALALGVNLGRFRLPVGLAVPLTEAHAAFAHVAAGLSGRAVLLP